MIKAKLGKIKKSQKQVRLEILYLYILLYTYIDTSMDTGVLEQALS